LTRSRGAHGSKGRTSWSGRPELDDYMSFAAFFMLYMSHLQPSPAPDSIFTPDQSPISPTAQNGNYAAQQQPTQEAPVVILGGYSYGSIILKHLPPVPSILQPFSDPLPGSAAGEILLRARKLTDQSNLEWLNLARDREREKRRPGRLSVTMGGEETSPEKRRSSRDIRRSMDGRRSLDLGNRLRSLSHRRRDEAATKTPPELNLPHSSITMPEIRYLLISPLTTPISAFAAPALASKMLNRSLSSFPDVIAKHETLVVYGDQDGFSSARRIREWVVRMKSESGMRFQSVEVNGAGHFWHEEGSEEELRAALRVWEIKVKGERMLLG
jgi:pimeloyl-ACP methyl ester carboxylesterase